ncbi:hypothetical protein pdam_00008810 [Pocillopora damicornis]|uniref:Uncharacterized protein n=1 Tax=Pocillopora damicornis TaxID=46731 RepID=A0A3M6URX1_POCDA|nr:hypothetical protein pdam_00008810 [Pocillopora damicornis]
MPYSNSSESSSISESDYSDFEASMEGEHNEGAYESAGPCDFSRLDEPKIKEHESQKRIMGPCAAAASTKKAKMCGCCQSIWKEKENIFCQEVDVVKNKNLKEVTVEQLQAEARCIVQHPGHTNVLYTYMPLNASCNHSWSTPS